MPGPDLTFAGTLQDERRLDQGIAFGSVLDQVLPTIPFIKVQWA